MAPPLSLEKLRRDLAVHITDWTDTDGEPIPETYHLGDRVVAYCIANGLATPYSDDGPVTVTHLGTKAYAVWRGNTAREYFEQRIVQPPEKKEKSIWDKPGSMGFQRQAATLLAGSFLLSPRDESTFQLYRIEDQDKRVVVPVSGSPVDVSVVISRVVAPTLAKENVAVTASKLGLMLTAFKATAPSVPAPHLLGQPGDDDWCLHRAAVIPDPSMPFPHIQEFFGRLNDGDAFAAWWWGVYSGLNKGRQIPYIEDHRGEGAKSVVLKALARGLFGDRIYTAFPSGANTSNDPHMSSHFVGKKLVIIGDCKNSFIIHSGALKELSGDDRSLVNPKFVQPFAVDFECRVIVASNHPPFMIREKHNTSRTLYLRLDPLDIPDEQRDVNYGKKCAAELPGFLHYAKTCYEARCPNHYAIAVNDKVKAATELRISHCETTYSAPFEEHFVIDATGLLPQADWVKVLRELRMDGHRAEDFLQWIIATTGAIQRIDPRKRSGWSIEGIRLRQGTDNWAGKRDDVDEQMVKARRRTSL